jgi:hypothetical protein
MLPLVVDLTRPTPGIGSRNQECPGFLDRARQIRYNAATARFDFGSTPIFAIWKQNQRGDLDAGIGDGTALIFSADHP